MDPYLERMVLPAIDCFRSHARRSFLHSQRHPGSAEDETFVVHSRRFSRLTELIYRFIQVRGRKTVVRLFPHQVDDLSIALSCLSPSVNPAAERPSEWAYRYIVLLWLSLITKIPFDLARFDTAQAHDAKATAETLEAIGKKYLDFAGMEGVGAALLLTGLYTRRDTGSLLPSFIGASIASCEKDPNSFEVIGILRVLTDIIKNSEGSTINSFDEPLSRLSSLIKERDILMGNTVIRHLMTKLTCRRALACLPPRPVRTRVKAKILEVSGTSSPNQVQNPDSNEDIDVPSFVEESLEDILASLQDKDTVVRWSAAKGLARTSERLPRDFNDQVLDSVLALFDIHTLPAELDEKPFGAVGDGGFGVQLPSSAESTWHGACLATAEFARRDLVGKDQLSNAIKWMSKALYFDVRKGSHSVGSSVRDAAAYVIWSLARSQDANTMKPFAFEIARRLVAVSVYDREVQIRRAASAAFQESVGRLNIFPHGIDVLRKTDFYAVSVRKNSFLVSAIQVAEHDEYRPFLIDHLIAISIRHWDSAMRALASQGLRALCSLDLRDLGQKVMTRITPLITSLDNNEVHGGLLTLAELADAFTQSGHADLQLEVYKLLAKLPPRLIKKYGNELVLSSICYALQTSLSTEALLLPQSETWWRPALDTSLKHRDVGVQESAARAMSSLSKLRSCTDYVKVASKDFPTSTPNAQQGYARTLGFLDFAAFDHGIKTGTDVLINALTVESRGYSKNVETRRNACVSLAQILLSSPLATSRALGGLHVTRIIQALITALEDYTIDERGDVGSWIRIAAINSLGSIAKTFLESSELRESPLLQESFPPELYITTFAALLKQGAERLDTVRREAGQQICSLAEARVALRDSDALRAWQLPGLDQLAQAFLKIEDIREFWSEGELLFPKLIPLLAISEYRKPLLHGLILSIGSKNEASRQPIIDNLKKLLQSLPISKPADTGALAVPDVSDDIFALAKTYYSTNSLMVPILNTLFILLDDEVAIVLAEDAAGLEIIKRILSLAGRNANKLKSIPRITACMKIAVATLSIAPLRVNAIDYVSVFLNHQFPVIRTATAEEIYIKMQTADLDLESAGDDEGEIEELLLETPWSNNGEYESASARVLAALRGAGA
ncbi:TBCD protein [Clavulina sp. PMI_390]|nr:TBCD protein [Clavulina sp. PMI_390]